MTAAIQTCSICRSDNRIWSLSFSTFKGRMITPGKILGCGHGFHPQCITQWIYRGQRACPMCHSPLSQGDTSFNFIQDPERPHLYVNKMNSCTLYIDQRFTPRERQLFLQKVLPSIIYITSAGVPKSSLSNPIFYVDHEGISHADV